jgi:hypothetical protein
MNTNSDINKEILEARKKFGEMYSNIKLGGKGTKIFTNFSRDSEKKEIGLA